VESYARVLDYLPNGRADERGFRREPVAIAVGESELKLLELIPRPGIQLALGARIALRSEEGSIDHVRRRIGFEELTATARSELAPALEEVVRSNPTKYLRFFNEAQPISRRAHLLELLPGIGKKTMETILEERRRRPFATFEDLNTRAHLKSSEKLVVGRIEQELIGVEDNYRIFVAP
jgi:putative nucleotide binding protein